MKSRTSALAVIVAVLLTGSALGIAGYRFFERRSHEGPDLSSASTIPGHAGRLADQLQLTNEQQKQLGVILQESRRQIETGRKEWELKLQEIRTKTNERIAEILSEQQKQKFKAILSTASSHGRSNDQGHGHGHE
jgi:Spy/CpxP family protein refolding chaperone